MRRAPETKNRMFDGSEREYRMTKANLMTGDYTGQGWRENRHVEAVVTKSRSQLGGDYKEC